MFRPRSRRGRLAFAVTALLAGCSTAQPPQTSAGESAAPPQSVVLLRIVSDPASPAGQAGRVEGGLWSMVTGETTAVPVSLRTSRLAQPGAAAGWMSVPAQPGRQFLRLRAAPSAAPQDFTFTAPDAPATVYAGTFRHVCDAQAAPICRLVPEDDSAGAREAVPAAQREQLPLVTRIARPYPPQLAGSGLTPPVAPAIVADPASWVAAVNWQAVLGDADALPMPPSGSFSGGDDALALLALPIIVIAAIPILLFIGIASSERRRLEQQTREDEAARQRADALRARVEQVQAAWSPCEATVATTLSPDRVAQRLNAALAQPTRAGRAARPAEPWQASVTRVVLRHCGTAPDSFGVEVATRWTGQRPGEAEPAFEAHFSRWVQGATPDTRLRFSDRPPWEVPVTPDAACRPLASWCGDGGAALLDEVLRAVTGARDAIAATR